MIVPKLHRWNSILEKDAYTSVEMLKNTSEPPSLSRRISFRADGSLKDLASIKKAIDEESNKYFGNLNNKSPLNTRTPQLEATTHKTYPQAKPVLGNK